MRTKRVISLLQLDFLRGTDISNAAQHLARRDQTITATTVALKTVVNHSLGESLKN